MKLRRTAVSIAIGIGAAAWASAQPAATFGQYRPAAPYSEAVTASQYLPMRDGVRLAVSVTRPARGGAPVEGRFPIIWQHGLAIEAAGPLAPHAEQASPGPAQLPGYRAVSSLVYDGYVIVQVARRGQGSSFGKRRGYNDRTEAYDAYEVIDWLAAQPWSTGAIGIYGCSNTGDASMHAVTAGNAHLKAAWAGCFSWEKYDAFLRGGIFANWGTGPERTLEQDLANTPVQGDEAKVLLRQAAEDHQGATVLADMWRAMPFRDDYAPGVGSRFWYEGSVASYMPQINASGTAIYIQGGWFDDLREQGLVTYANLIHDKHILIGPWGHCRNDDFDLLSEMRRFFDQHLKGIDTGIPNQEPIHYFTINAPAGREWRASPNWPVVGTRPTAYYLSGHSPAGGDLQLRSPVGAGARSTFAVRYDVDCPTLVKRPDGLLTGAPPCPVVFAGPHFFTPALKADTEITGDPVADLWVSSSASDGNFFIYLEDVAPDGKVVPVTDGRLKASLRKLDKPRYDVLGLPWHRSDRQDAEPLTPGRPARLVFNLLPTSYVFKAGHRIQISVAGADYRERDRSPVSPAPVVTLYDTPANPSFVALPIIDPHPW
jgi:putative CocE/NonD family hydrolase